MTLRLKGLVAEGEGLALPPHRHFPHNRAEVPRRTSRAAVRWRHAEIGR